MHRPVKDLTADERELLWKGNQHFWGINDFFADIEEKTYKIQNRVRWLGLEDVPLVQNVKVGD